MTVWKWVKNGEGKYVTEAFPSAEPAVVEGERTWQVSETGRRFIDDGKKYVVRIKGDYKIAVNNVEHATNITLWETVEVKGREYDKEIGALNLSIKPDNYLTVNEIAIDKLARGKRLGTEMYRVALEYSEPSAKGIKSYIPSRVSKKEVPAIYKRLNAREEGDYQYIDKPTTLAAVTQASPLATWR